MIDVQTETGIYCNYTCDESVFLFLIFSKSFMKYTHFENYIKTPVKVNRPNSDVFITLNKIISNNLLYKLSQVTIHFHENANIFPFSLQVLLAQCKMCSTEERVPIFCARVRGLSYEDARAEFTHKFRKPAPTRTHIRHFVNRFKRIGSVCDEAR